MKDTITSAFKVHIEYIEPMKHKNTFVLSDLNVGFEELAKEIQGTETLGVFKILIEHESEVNSIIEIKVLETSDIIRYPNQLNIAEFLWNCYINPAKTLVDKVLMGFVELRLKEVGLNFKDICKINSFEEFKDFIGSLVRNDAENMLFKTTIMEALESSGKLRPLSDSDLDKVFDAGLWFVPTVCIIDKFEVANPDLQTWIIENIIHIILAYTNIEPTQIFLALPKEQMTDDFIEEVGCNVYTVENLIEMDTKGVYIKESKENAKVYYLQYDVDEEIEDDDEVEICFKADSKEKTKKQNIFTVVK